MNRLESNKLLAEFMGVFDKILSTQNIHSWSDAPFYYTTENSKEKVIENISNYVKYDTDWNWLMQVVEKIENYNEFANVLFAPQGCAIDVYIENGFAFSNDCNTKIEAVYNACVEFVKWFNNQNK
jgi:hypothetical protein